MARKQLKDRAEETLKFLEDFISNHPYPPTVREIAKGIGVTSSATAQFYLNELEKNGKIRRSNSKNRSIELVDKPFLQNQDENVEYIPVVGKVAAGTPILATENIEDTIPLPKTMFKKSGEDLFALNVTGDSMVNAGILNGDKIVVRKQPTARDGDIVVALIEDSATVKRFYKEKDVIRLQPENDYMNPMFFKEVEIIGVVVGLIRKF